MRTGIDGSFSAVEAVDQSGFASDENGSGMICRIIQNIGNRIANENCASNRIATLISLCGAIAAPANMTAAAREIICPATTSLVIAKTGVAASSRMRRRGANDKSENFGQ